MLPLLTIKIAGMPANVLTMGWVWGLKGRLLICYSDGGMRGNPKPRRSKAGKPTAQALGFPASPLQSLLLSESQPC